MGDMFKTLVQLPIADACFWIGLTLLVFVLAFSKVRDSPIQNRRALGGIAAALLAAALLIWVSPAFRGRADAGQGRVGDRSSLDWGLVESLWFTETGQFQVALVGRLPEADAMFHGNDPWAQGDNLPDVAKQAIFAAQAGGKPVGIVIRQMDGEKYVIAEVYIGESEQ